MTVYFIGAGPGAPDLITVRGLKLIERCKVCLYAGSASPCAGGVGGVGGSGGGNLTSGAMTRCCG